MAPGRAVESNVQQLRTATRFSPERQKFSAYQLGERRCIAANTARLPAHDSDGAVLPCMIMINLLFR